MAENRINYEEIIEKYPWIFEKGQKAILSPDCDGMLCGLLMSHYFDWEITGFYDGKFLLLKDGLSVKDCIFLDMDILRNDIRSVGHHMNIHNFNSLPEDYKERTANLLNPNHLRRFGKTRDFARKYPFATIHLLFYLLAEKYPKKVDIKKEGFGAIFFADGVWKILFKYTDNVLDWFDYFHVKDSAAWWDELKQVSVIDLIKEMNLLTSNLHKIRGRRGWGHINLENFDAEKDALIKHLELFGNLTGWYFDKSKWCIDNLNKYTFTKKIDSAVGNNEKFFLIWKNALSLAMTDRKTAQYTLEEPDKLP